MDGFSRNTAEYCCWAFIFIAGCSGFFHFVFRVFQLFWRKTGACAVHATTYLFTGRTLPMPLLVIRKNLTGRCWCLPIPGQALKIGFHNRPDLDRNRPMWPYVTFSYSLSGKPLGAKENVTALDMEPAEAWSLFERWRYRCGLTIRGERTPASYFNTFVIILVCHKILRISGVSKVTAITGALRNISLSVQENPSSACWANDAGKTPLIRIINRYRPHCSGEVF